MATRRRFVSGLAAAGVLAAASARAAIKPKPRRKVSQARAKYQDHPMDIRACATCTLFQAPDGCKAVLGKVSPDGWCDLFEIAD